MATLVLPAPVGAQSRRFLSEWNASGNTLDCTLFKWVVSVVGNATLAHCGKSSIETSFSPSS